MFYNFDIQNGTCSVNRKLLAGASNFLGSLITSDMQFIHLAYSMVSQPTLIDSCDRRHDVWSHGQPGSSEREVCKKLHSAQP